MNIERSSSARSDSGNQGRSVNENGVEEGLKKVYGKMKTLENLKKTLLAACVVALAIDPLFLFIPEIDSKRSCFSFDKNLSKTVCALRTFVDTFYVIHVIICFINQVILCLDRSQSNSLRGEVMSVHYNKPVKKRRIPFYLINDIVSILPIPQVVVLSLIVRSSASVVPKRRLISFTKWIVVFQYIPRVIRIYPLYKEVTRTSGTIAESNWIGAALNLFLFFLYSYVFGAFWYVNGVEKKTRCWREVCDRTSKCDRENLFCSTNLNNTGVLYSACSLIDPDDITNMKANSSAKPSNHIYDFGMYIDVLKSGVAEVKPRDFPRKFVYCFWWGLRNLSTFGQGLKPGNYATDIFFATIICASGLFLFSVLIGNVQKYLISTTVRVEEMKERQRDTEKWMSSRALPDELKERIRKYENYKWREFRGAEEDALLRSLPKDLRLETKRHLYKNMLKSVPLLEIMNDWQLDALYDRAKSVFYPADSCIVKEGDPVEEMLIVTKGQLKCTTKSSGETTILKKGDICGDLHLWIFSPSPSPDLPTSNKTVMTITDVEGFILLPDDLKFVASHLDHVQCLKVKERFRSLSEQRRSECSSSSEPQKSAVTEISKD